ncbi:hypothetical protein ACF0H5_007206 [Mactra antiquata]
MEDSVIDRSIQNVLRWTRLKENYITNPEAGKALKIKDTLIKTERPYSIVYHAKHEVPGLLPAQRQHFRLTPLTALQDVPFELGNCPGKTGTVFSDLNAWSRQEHISRFHTSRPSTRPINYPTRQTINQPTQQKTPTKERLGSAVSTRSTSRQSDNSTSSTPLPVFRRREPTSVFLFRRPIVEQPIPLTEDDELFVALAKTIDLKALPFKKQAESYLFYETYYPLLLTAMSKDTERANTPNRRARTPDSPMTIMINRQRALNMRLVEQDSLMEKLERETEDCDFVTELHDNIFNPTKWTWNKIDVSGLRRRYTIDASLKEM